MEHVEQAGAYPEQEPFAVRHSPLALGMKTASIEKQA
jgi:hypothetical protein